MKEEKEFLVSEDYSEIVFKNDDEYRYGCGNTEPYEPYTFNIKRLFKSMMKEYGRCVSKVYIGETKPKAIGWVFQKNAEPDRNGNKRKLETWVTLHERKPETKTQYFYKTL
jgi:hypothetical protein